jgi:hypothetical protein
MLYIYLVLESNLGLESGCSVQSFCCFSQYHKSNARIVCYDHFISVSSVIHQLSFPSVGCDLRYINIS